ncbi:MAG TPA: response regulator [Bryobacteraceae bacterium]|nr:response regulator [Bryobacteraceae bacterium]
MTYGRSKSLLFKLEHEIRQTLHHLMGMLEIAMEAPLTAAQAAYLGECRAGADRLLQVANDVAELADPDRPSPSVSTFSPAAMAQEAGEIMAAIALQKGLEFRLSVEPTIPEFVSSERDMIQDILRRILDNSIKFTARGSITLSVTSERLAEPDSAMLIFDVIDTGPGISKEILEEFREPAESARTGLGISVVQRRLADMNGRFTVESSTVQGTAVRISLPVKLPCSPPAAVKATERDLSAQPPAALPLKLLVAEDSNDSFNLFQVYVRGQGHAVSRALNGAEAVAMVQCNEYDLVVMDVDMPLMDGYTATRTIREWETQQGRTRIPIVLLSAESASRQRQMGASIGCSGYLTKPVPREEVLRALNYFSNGRSS